MSDTTYDKTTPFEALISNESEEGMDLESLRHDALAWTGKILESCKTSYQCSFYAKQYVKIFNTISQ